MPRTTRRTIFRVKRSKVKVTRPITTETESVSYLPGGKAYTNFKIGTQMERTLSTATASYNACVVGLLHAGGVIPCRPQTAATQLVS